MSQQETIVEKYVPEDENLTYKRWESALRDDVLLGQVCDDCGHVVGVPKSVCGQCKDQNLSATRLPETGEVYSATVIEVTPAGQADRYQVGIVDLDETRVLARLSGTAEIGDQVSFVGHIEYDEMPGPVFE